MSGKPVRLDGQVAVKIAICLAALGVFFWLLVQPKMAEVTRLDAEIVEAREVISRQGKLFPLYAAIYADLAQADLTPFPELRGGLLGLEDIPRIPDLLGSLARAHGLEVRSVTPAPESLDVEAGTLRTQCVLLGDLDGMRRFLAELGGVEWVQGMQALRFEDSGGRTLATLTTVVRLAGQRATVAGRN
jgi:hypothetical protein